MKVQISEEEMMGFVMEQYHENQIQTMHDVISMLRNIEPKEASDRVKELLGQKLITVPVSFKLELLIRNPEMEYTVK